MQCVAQGAPLVGVSLTVLNRRNIKAWAESHGLAGRGQDLGRAEHAPALVSRSLPADAAAGSDPPPT